MKQVFLRWTNWLFDEYKDIGAEAVCAFRIFYASAMIFYGVIPYTRISTYAAELYYPKRSLVVWFDLPDPIFFQVLDWFILILLILLLFGVKAKWTSIVLGISLIVGNSFLYSFGKINHGNLLTTFTPLILAFSNWDVHYSISKYQKSNKVVQFWPISMMAFIIGFGMTVAGVIKLYSGWLNPNFQAIKFHVFKSYFNLIDGALTELFVQMNSVFVWEALDYFIVIFEVGFLLVVFSRKWFERWVMMAICFHIGVLLTIDISFAKNVIIYFLFLDWMFIMNVLGFKKVLEFLSKGFNVFSLILTIGLFSWLKYFHGSSNIFQLFPLMKISPRDVLFMLALFVMVGSLVYRFLKRKK